MTGTPAHAHINIWHDAGASWEDTTAREIGERLRRQPGRRFCALVRTAEREVVAIAIFDSEADLERAVATVAPLVHERVRALTVGEPERRQGAVLYATGPEPAATRAA